MAGAHRGLATFRHGVHPAEHKDATCALPIERLPFVDEYVLPLSQHIGAPSKALVQAGDEVKRGQLIAKPGGFVSVGLHAPVTGKVVAVELRPHPNGLRMPAIVIRTDPYSSQKLAVEPPPPADTLDAASFTKRIQEAGMVGLGGAAFPSHVKLSVPEGKRVQFLILNGCECEPYLTCDDRVMVERPDAVMAGLRIILAKINAERAYVGIEANKPEAVERMKESASGDSDVEIWPLQVKYPQGAEKMLIDSIFKKEVPAGKLPLDLEMVVHNVGTAAAIHDYFETGLPLIERVVTITGDGIDRPSNLVIPLGTPLQAVVDHCGGLRPGVRQVIMGGPMMGQAQKDLSAPTLKGTSGILILRSALETREEQACIRCGRCVDACPMFLNPSRLATLIRAEEVDLSEEYNLLDCFECASCSFSCPSSIPLVHLLRMGKAMIRNKKAST